uniref:uncharacterized protein LOC120813874 n=1 Tax=Gasterosteus aculeatus aculeatus TaxID=481459 RepID=UPI001A98523C|nr:uncharacterized protein LOC120813874 [Gasterosteus aculeatus aculeatus]
MFPTSTDHSPNSLHITCEMSNPDRPSVLFHLYEGVEVPKDRDERFAGRVQWDKDALREGRLKFHISRLQTNDSGLYWCGVFTSYGKNYKECRLNVTAVKDRPEHETTSDTSLRGDPRGRIGLYWALGLAAAAAAAAALLVSFFSCALPKRFMISRTNDASEWPSGILVVERRGFGSPADILGPEHTLKQTVGAYQKKTQRAQHPLHL